MSDQTQSQSQVSLNGIGEEGDPFNELTAVQLDNETRNTPEQKMPIPEGMTIISDENLNDFIAGKKTTEASQDAPVKEEAKKEEEKPAIEAIKMTPDTMIVDPRDGKTRSWKEVEGQTILQKRYQEQKKAIDEIKPYVDANLPYLQAMDKSAFGKVYATALVSGLSEEKAIEAGLAAVGKSQPAQQTQQAPTDPEPVFPPPGVENDDPSYLKAFNEHQAWVSRQAATNAVNAQLKPFLDKLEARDKAEADKAQAYQRQQAQVQAVAKHNSEMLKTIGEYLPFDINSLTESQQTQFLKTIDETSAKTGLDQIARTEQLRVSDIKALAYDAFGGKNPFAAQEQIEKPQSPKKAPQQGGSSGATISQSLQLENPADEKERVRSILREMAL